MDQLIQTVEEGCTNADGAVHVFFRADDIGVPGVAFTRMVELFNQFEMPLCLAVVPTWLSRPRYATLRKSTGNSKLFCWHQHGWLHRNHQLSGKKGEFGEDRPKMRLRADLINGKNRCEALLEDDFYPVFTPPWNRCSEATLELLRELGFTAISRSAGASPAAITGLPDFQVNVDLHTRKEKKAADCLAALLGELRRGLASGQVGIMLHHQRMNNNGFLLLSKLLQAVKSSKHTICVDFRTLAQQ